MQSWNFLLWRKPEWVQTWKKQSERSEALFQNSESHFDNITNCIKRKRNKGISGRWSLGGNHKMAAVPRAAERRSPRAAGSQRLLHASPRGGSSARSLCCAACAEGRRRVGRVRRRDGTCRSVFQKDQIWFAGFPFCLFVCLFLKLVAVSVFCIGAICILHSSSIFVPSVWALISITTCLAIHPLFTLHLKEALSGCRAKWFCLIWHFRKGGGDRAMYYEVNKESTRSVWDTSLKLLLIAYRNSTVVQNATVV